MPSVLVSLKLPPEHLAPLPSRVEIIQPEDPLRAWSEDEVIERLGDCVALINQGELRVDDRLLDAGPKLKIVANVAMGIDNLDLEAISRRGIWASNTPDAFVESTADCALGLLLATVRRLVEADAFVRAGKWAKAGKQPRLWEGTRLRGKTLGLVGYGQIAQAVEARALGFGLRVLHTRSRSSEHDDYRPLETLLAESDFVVILVPLTPQTRHLIDAAALAKMKPGAVLLNLARGPVVDEAALVAALQSGHLGGAGLDVFEHEPEVDPALFAMKQVVLAPHLGGSTVEDRRAGRLQAAANVLAVLDGNPPPDALNEV